MLTHKNIKTKTYEPQRPYNKNYTVTEACRSLLQSELDVVQGVVSTCTIHANITLPVLVFTIHVHAMCQQRHHRFGKIGSCGIQQRGGGFALFVLDELFGIGAPHEQQFQQTWSTKAGIKTCRFQNKSKSVLKNESQKKTKTNQQT